MLEKKPRGTSTTASGVLQSVRLERLTGSGFSQYQAVSLLNDKSLVELSGDQCPATQSYFRIFLSIFLFLN